MARECLQNSAFQEAVFWKEPEEKEGGGQKFPATLMSPLTLLPSMWICLFFWSLPRMKPHVSPSDSSLILTMKYKSILLSYFLLNSTPLSLPPSSPHIF